jgi:hypothetical protein
MSDASVADVIEAIHVNGRTRPSVGAAAKAELCQLTVPGWYRVEYVCPVGASATTEDKRCELALALRESVAATSDFGSGNTPTGYIAKSKDSRGYRNSFEVTVVQRIVYLQVTQAAVNSNTNYLSLVGRIPVGTLTADATWWGEHTGMGTIHPFIVVEYISRLWGSSGFDIPGQPVRNPV